MTTTNSDLIANIFQKLVMCYFSVVVPVIVPLSTGGEVRRMPVVYKAARFVDLLLGCCLDIGTCQQHSPIRRKEESEIVE